MKIALFINQFPKISETFILNQIDGLVARGHEITIFPRRFSGETTVHDIVESRRLLEKTHFPPAAAQTLSDKVDFFRRRMMLYLTRRKSVSHLKDTFGQYSRISNWHRAFNVAEPVLRHGGNFDVLFAHFGPNGVRAHWYRDAGLITGSLVTVFHGYDVSSYLNGQNDKIYDGLFREGDLFMPISRFWLDKLRDLGCPREKLKVHHVGIDCEQFSFQPRTRNADDRTVLVSVARLVEKKGIEYAIRALAGIVAENSNVQYRIIGDGPMSDELKQLVADLRLGDHVRFLGTKTNKEVVDELSRAHVFLAPSVTSRSGDMEGIPTVLMEAMAAGLPVISTLHSGIPELVEDGVSGKLVGERDVPAMIQAIQEVITHVERWPAMGSAGRQKVLEEFNMGKLNGQLETLFSQLC